ncbi:12494_t:CDS:2 [Acaulospora colombiana]|uniref:12494_t:CDS:1 n=1 Tax=Acaulospora colombiana TaxID=27376 RepID=A0ACA9KRM6_9GLOM|nr:12494_t:CDS:2 [Acaulospora colombiana]
MEQTDKIFDHVAEEIKNAGEMLNLASLSLRACFIDNASSVKSFVDLRSEVTNEARVYSHKILPFANAVVLQIRKFCENYLLFSFDEFKEYIADLADEAKDNVDVCKFTCELHKAILVEFKKKEDKAKIVLKQLELEVNEFEKRKKEFLKASGTKYAWAVCLILVPVVNLIATPLLISGGDKDVVRAVAASEEKLLTVAAIEAIRDPLSYSIENFVKSITKIAGFFQLLTDELTMLAQDHQEKPKKMHYERVKRKASPIIEACRLYSLRAPDSETNLQAIPENFDKNYVQEWLSKRETNIDNETLSFFKWGKRLFTSNKKLVDMLAIL